MSLYGIKKILVPVDLSETSLNALDTAVALAKKHDAEIVLLNVIENKYAFIDENIFQSTGSLTNSSDVLSALAGAIQHSHEIQPRLL